jgi:pilus assembly protein CpaD
MTVMSRIPHLLALGLTGLAAAGCTAPPLNNDGRYYYDVEQEFPITVEPQVATLAVQVDDGLNALGRGEDQRVAAFAQRWKARGQGLMNVATPSGGGDSAGAMAQLKKLLAANGVDKGAVQFTTYNPAGGDTQAPITLSFVAYAATAQECGGDWSRNLGFEPRNLPRPNFGCSTQHNLAAVVADPHDLIEPRTSDPSDALRRSIVIEKYQQGQPTQAQRDEALDTGQSSSVDPKN